MTKTVIPVVLVLLLVWLVGTYNRLVNLRAAVHSSWASVEALLKRRADLIPQLVSAVKGGMSYESDLLTRVTEARGAALGAHSTAERAAAESRVAKELQGLIAVVEAYPELMANAQILLLQEQLTATENDIASARRYYNAVVRDYNIQRESFPQLLVAGALGFRKADFFAIDDDDRAVPSALGER